MSGRAGAAVAPARKGALSNTDGCVGLRWHVVYEGDAPRFRLTVSEQGGPSILTQSRRLGFGSRLIERSFTAEAGGEVMLTYASVGPTYWLETPLASMQDRHDASTA